MNEWLVGVVGAAEPTPPLISGHDEDRALTAGDVVVLACTAGVLRDAVGWQRDQHPLVSNCSTTTTLGGDVVSTCRLSVVTRPDHNGAVYSCAASYAHSTLTSSIRLTVLCE